MKQIKVIKNSKLINILFNLPVALAIWDNKEFFVFCNKEFLNLLYNGLINLNDDIFTKKEFNNTIRELAGKKYLFSTYKFPDYSLFLGIEFFNNTNSYFNFFTQLDFIFTTLRHEIGNPINTIQFSLSVLKKNFKNYSPEKIISIIDRVIEETKHLEKILIAMKNISVLKEAELKKIELKSFLENILTLTEMEATQKDIKQQIYISETSVFVKADPTMLQQVILNIIRNSFEALESVEKNRKIEITSEKENNIVQLIFKDNGPGIPKEIKDKILLPFFSTKHNGTGIGLTLSQRLMLLMGGSLKIVNCSKGKGAKIILNLQLWEGS